MLYKHDSILVNELINFLEINQKPLKKVIVDCTLGLGGHSKAFLDLNDQLKIIAIDQDKAALEIAKKNLSKYLNNLSFFNCNFNKIAKILNSKDKVDSFLLDLGVSSMHFDNPDRGFSYKHLGKLDMRMDQNSNTITAYDIVNKFSCNEISQILKNYGEESFAKLIAKEICKQRLNKEIIYTTQLDEIIKQSLPKKVLYNKKNPSTKTFQALRIYVNNELDNLKQTLNILPKYLNKNGIIAIITFHSLEDRIVKNFFKTLVKPIEPYGIFTKEEQKIFSKFTIITKKPIIPTKEEIALNSRAKSAKLRIIKKVKD